MVIRSIISLKSQYNQQCGLCISKLCQYFVTKISDNSKSAKIYLNAKELSVNNDFCSKSFCKLTTELSLCRYIIFLNALYFSLVISRHVYKICNLPVPLLILSIVLLLQTPLSCHILSILSTDFFVFSSASLKNYYNL